MTDHGHSDGLMHWHNEYIHRTLQRPGSVAYKSPDEAVEQMSGEGSAAVIGTPEPLAPLVVATAPAAPFWGGAHDEGRASFSPGRREVMFPSLPFVFCGLAATSSGQRAPCPVKWAAIFQG